MQSSIRAKILEEFMRGDSISLMSLKYDLLIPEIEKAIRYRLKHQPIQAEYIPVVRSSIAVATGGNYVQTYPSPRYV